MTHTHQPTWADAFGLKCNGLHEEPRTFEEEPQ